MCLRIDFGGHAFELLADRAMYWPMARTLIMADMHIGKADTFRALGVPVPAGVTAKDLARVNALLQKTSAERLLILGDFLHAREAQVVTEELLAWRAEHIQLQIDLVIGNHDRRAGALDAALNVREIDVPHFEHGLAFVHDPADRQDAPTLCGHIHPQAWLADFDSSGAKVPCFVVEEKCVVLPSFGSFTGGCVIGPRPHRRLFLAAAGRVLEVKYEVKRTAVRRSPRYFRRR